MSPKKISMALGSIAIAASLALAGCSTGDETENENIGKNGTTAEQSEDSGISDNANDGIDNKGEQLTPENDTEQGSFQITNADNITEDTYRVDVFVDPACPACQMVDSTMNERWLEEAKEGTIDLYVTPVPFLNDSTVGDYSTRASNAFITIAEEEPELAMEFLGKIYEPSFFPGVGPQHRPTSDAALVEAAKDVGVSDELAEKIPELHYVDWITQNTDDFETDSVIFPQGITTPTVVLGLEYGEENKAIDNDDTHIVSFSGNIEGDYDSQLEEFLN